MEFRYFSYRKTKAGFFLASAETKVSFEPSFRWTFTSHCSENVIRVFLIIHSAKYPPLEARKTIHVCISVYLSERGDAMRDWTENVEIRDSRNNRWRKKSIDVFLLVYIYIFFFYFRSTGRDLAKRS